MEIRVVRAVPETRRGVSPPDFAVGTGAGVHMGQIRPSRAAPARPRRGASEIVWVSHCLFSLRDNLTRPRVVKAALA